MAVGDTYILDEKQGKTLNRIDTKTNWEAVNPVLAIGEMGIEKDGLLQNIKIGDGVTPWNSLQYMLQGRSLNRIDTKANWEAVNPILAIGEMGIEKDGLLQNIKIGDGVTPWNGLQYMFKSCPYEVGDILVTMNATDPAVRWPGTTWEVFAPGRVLIGAGKGTDVNGTSMEFAVGATGGEYSHQLTVGELPKTEGYFMHIAWGEVENGCGGIVTDEQGYPPHQEAQASEFATITKRTVIRFGNNEKHQIIQPFSACFLYKRLT